MRFKVVDNRVCLDMDHINGDVCLTPFLDALHQIRQDLIAYKPNLQISMEERLDLYLSDRKRVQQVSEPYPVCLARRWSSSGQEILDHPQKTTDDAT